MPLSGLSGNGYLDLFGTESISIDISMILFLHIGVLDLFSDFGDDASFPSIAIRFFVVFWPVVLFPWRCIGWCLEA